MSNDTPRELKRQIGPYLIEQPLGRGGMGEVYRAFDQRLQRRVALKRIHAEGEVGEPQQQRFLREARAAARLSHGNIAQIYDILEQEDELWIVMEWVKGETLRSHLEPGPLPMANVLRLAHEIAEGLTAAHAEGIVHRDLKSENVMIADSGSAKILDFGLAKLEAQGGAEEDTLTKMGAVLGTPRSMAPEQAMGFVVDHRADFFAFGVLLYEAITGVSPFRGPSAAVTLRKLCVEKPVPIRVRAPHVPVHVESLVNDLLEKEPIHRPGSGAEILQRLSNPMPSWERQGAIDSEPDPTPTAEVGSTIAGDGERSWASIDAGRTLAQPDPWEDFSRPIGDEPKSSDGPPGSTGAVTFVGWARYRFWLPPFAALLVLVVGYFGWRQIQRADSQHVSVAVLQPELRIGEGDERSELLLFTLRSAMLRSLTAFQDRSPKSPGEVDAVTGPPSVIARATGADEVLAAALVCQALDCQVELRRIQGEDGVLLDSLQVEVPLDDLLTATKMISSGVIRLYPESSTSVDPSNLSAAPEDFSTYVNIRRAFDTKPETLTLPTLLDELERLRTTSPRFIDAFVLEAEIATAAFLETREPELLQRAFDLIERALELDPRNTEILNTRIWIEIQAGQLDQAFSTLARLEELEPGDVRILDRRAEILIMRGEVDEGLALCRLAITRRPSWKRYYRYADYAQKNGDVEAARKSLEDLLTLSPGNIRGISLLGRLELQSGDLNRAIELYTALVSEAPSPARYSNLGIAHMLAGDYAKSAEILELAVEMAPMNAVYLLNLAEARGLEGRLSPERLYRQVLDLIGSSPSDDVNELVLQAQALSKLGDHHRAVATIQKALGKGIAGGEVAFQAALVFTLSGDHTAAVVNAKAAIEQGYNARWLRLPWFDPLRVRPEFVELLDAED